MLQSFRNRSDYPFWFEVAPLVLTTAILMVQFFIFKDYTPHVPLIIVICITGLFMSLKGRKWIDMEHNMYRVMKVALPTMVIIMCVGMVIASWIAAGTVPTILDFGLGMLSPRIFLPATCILATVVSLATGTSWGTVGTVGLAIMGIAQALGVPEYWAAGAVVSGAFFGDKMSPLSDTTNLTPAVAGTDLWSHIRSMLTNTIPAYALTLIIYTWVGMDYGTDGGMGSLEMREAIQNTVQSNFQLGWVTLIPPVVVITMGFRKYSVMGTLCTGVFIGALIAVFYQGVSLDKISGILMNGYTATTGQEYVDKLLTKGGILNMGMVAGEVYTSLVLPGRLMKSKYAEMGYDRAILSRTIEDWGTLVSPLIPWNNGGAFVTSTLGISTFLYAPFALFCWLSPLIGLIYAALGWFTPLDPKGPQKIEEEEMEDIADEVEDYMV